MGVSSTNCFELLSMSLEVAGRFGISLALLLCGCASKLIGLFLGGLYVESSRIKRRILQFLELVDV